MGRVDGDNPEWRRADWMILAGVAVLSAAVFAPGITGDFVYDDAKQIVQNEFLRDGRYFWTAMASDVWGFKGDKTPGAGESTNWSNYWRPTFVLWLMLNYRLWGLESTVGWHLSNVALHVIVCWLAYALLRRLGLGRPIAGGIVCLFAVHPVHVESVTWISGSPDLLLAAGMLGALGCLLSAVERRSALPWIAAVLLYLLGLLAKESGILFPAIFLVVVYQVSREPHRIKRIRSSVVATLPFVLVAVAYLVLHGRVVRVIQPQWAPGWWNSLLTAPSILVFYLRQGLFPLWVGPHYPLRAVVRHADLERFPLTEPPGAFNFWLPVVVCLIAAAAGAWLARSDRVRKLGLLLFLLPLAPALYINAFKQEEMVHDRYLYLPLLGLLMLLVATLVTALGRLDRRAPGRAERVTAILAIALCLPLGLQTARYSTAWTSERRLWQWAVRSDPGSSSAHAALGSVYRRLALEATDPEERTRWSRMAREEIDRALEIHPVTDGYLMRASLAIDAGRLREAELELGRVLAVHPDFTPAIDLLVKCYLLGGRHAQAAQLIRAARDRLPHERCSLTEKLAVVLYQAGQRELALRELESVRAEVAAEYGAGAKKVLFRLGMLYAEQGRSAEAAEAFRSFLRLSEGIVEPEFGEMRRIAGTLLERLGAGPGSADPATSG